MRLFNIFNNISLEKIKVCLREWFRDSYKHLFGRIVGQSLICEIKFENMSSKKLLSFCSDLDHYIQKRKKEELCILDQIRGFAELEPYRKYLCEGKKIDIEGVQWVSRVALASDIINYSLGKGKDEYLDDMADSPKAIDFISQRLKKMRERGKPLGELRGRLPLIWITKSSELKDIKQEWDSDEMANKIVLELGINHLERGYLVEILIPLRSLEHLHTPTVIDADFSEYFLPAKEADKWGRTLQLQTLQSGLPEAVHPSIAIGENFSFLPIGELHSGLEEMDVDKWESFYIRTKDYLMSNYPEYRAEHEELFSDLEGYDG